MEDVNGRIKDNIYDKILPYGKEILTTSPEPDAILDYKDDDGNGKSSIGDRSIALDSISPISENKRLMDFM